MTMLSKNTETSEVDSSLSVAYKHERISEF